MKNYINYHSHSSLSNLSTPDSTISNEDRTIRAIELGQNVVSYIEHGSAISFLEGIPLSQKHNIKPLLGSEVYFVPNRFEKDRTNAHLVLLAKNENGRKSINRIISEANLSGYYYKPRIDFELLFSLPKNDVWTTSACLGGIWKFDNSEEIMLKIFDYFGKNNFFLEFQTHHVEAQRELNKRIIDLSNHYGISTIAALDSHMIFPEQAKLRNDYLLSRGISYPEEENWFLDFCDYNTFYQRFVDQGVLNKTQIEESIDNTNIFQDVEKYTSIIFDKNIIKLPTLYPDKDQEHKDQILTNLVWQRWDLEKNNVDISKWEHYKYEIQKELDVIIKTKTSDYFLLDYEVIKRGKELGGSITLTGRGSAVSFYISKLLDFTTVDRISASVKLFPERFISAERLLEAKSLPDIDLNLGTPQIFAEAQSQIMGQEHNYPMITFGKLRSLAAWKLYARTEDISFDMANIISENIQQYELDLKHADDEEEKEQIDIYTYIDPKYHEIYNKSKQYLGLINSITIHPCAYLIFSDGDIKEEFGLIKTKVGQTEHICACCEGHFAEDYKLLKNDLLKVSVVDLIYQVYDKVGRRPHTLNELIEQCNNNQDVWNVYKNAWTVGINQFEKTGTSGRGAKYAPKNISELSSFIAAIRPAFKSNYKQFESREHFEYGIPSLDKLIQTPEFPESYMLYQETIMQVLNYAGISLSETYEIIKNIAKKRAEKVYKYKNQFIEGMKNKLIEVEKRTEEDANKVAGMTWKIIEDSAFYSFNAAHSYSYAGDSLYCAYLKAMYPLAFYETFLRMMEEDGDKDRLARARDEAERAFHIKFPQFKFGQDNRTIVMDKETNSITSSLKTIKGFGSVVGENLYKLSQDFDGKDFLDLLIFSEENDYLSSKFESLIKINYFDKFGKNKKLHEMYMEFTKGKNRYNKKLTQKSKDKRLPELRLFFDALPNEGFSFKDQLDFDTEILGYTQSTFNVDKKYVYVTEVDEKYAPRINVYNLQKGTTQTLKIQKRVFKNIPIKKGNIILCNKFEKKPSVKFINGQYEETEEFTWWLSDYNIIKDFDKIKEE